eukprot:3189013-Prymnesium_polylepis.1
MYHATQGWQGRARWWLTARCDQGSCSLKRLSAAACRCRAAHPCRCIERGGQDVEEPSERSSCALAR